MKQISFKNRVIKSGYVIAVYDKTIGIGPTDPYKYFTSDNIWGFFKQAKIYANEACLAKGIMDAKPTVEFFEHEGPYPIYWQTTIDLVDEKTFDHHLLQQRREIAMAKLDDEDMIALGLLGGPEK